MTKIRFEITVQDKMLICFVYDRSRFDEYCFVVPTIVVPLKISYVKARSHDSRALIESS